MGYKRAPLLAPQELLHPEDHQERSCVGPGGRGRPEDEDGLKELYYMFFYYIISFICLKIRV